MQLTEEQRQVVMAPVSDLLVSAAAGSGKTAVMTERIVQRIVAGDLDIQSVLVMTFTEAAARQMKSKIADKLDQARKEQADPVKKHELGRQLTLLPGAAISTIHAFCLTVIRDFSHLAVDEQGSLQVEPGFAVSDPQVASLLLRETLDAVLARRYEAIDQHPAETLAWQTAFYHLVDSYSTSRSDQPLRDQIISLYQYLRSLPDYRQAVARYQAELAIAARDFSASRHARVLMDQLRVLLGQALLALPELRDLLDSGVELIKDQARNRTYHEQFRRLDQILVEVDALLHRQQPDWDQVVELAAALSGLELPRAGGKDPGKARVLELLRQQLAEAIYCLSGQCGTAVYREHFLFETNSLFNRTASQIEQEIAAMLPAVEQLFELVLELDTACQDRKREQGLVDFGDFEHLALAILRQPEAAAYYRQRYREIYIDEYQDTSSIQEALLRAIAGDNLFMVGDVKQSIYRFRHARPGIFMGRFEQYRQGQAGQLWTLSRNFRSVSGVLQAVNEIFTQLMSPAAGEIDYTDGHQLVPVREPLPDTLPVELFLVRQDVADADLPADPGPSDPEAGQEPADGQDMVILEAAELTLYEREALAVGSRIADLLAAGSCQPRDVVILARTRAIVRIYAAALKARGIATLEDTGRTLFDSPDLRLVKALLQVMDNARQDIPLAAVLRSGLLAPVFTPHDLLAIRIAARAAAADCRFFHEAFAYYADHGPDPALSRRIRDFQAALSLWRDRARFRKTGEWLEWLFDATGFYQQAAAAENGTNRQRELRAFVSWVHQFEASRSRGLFDLVRHLENLERNGFKEAPYDLARNDQNAVRVLTIHSSKGLEFPIVFLVGLAARITAKDQKDILMVSETLGIGFDWVDPAAHLRRISHLKLAMLAEHRATSLAEELRLLYVAMTRARDQLILAALLPKAGLAALAERMEKVRAVQDLVLPAHLVLSGSSYLDWLLMALARHPDLDWSNLHDTASQPAAALPEPTRGVWQLRVARLADYLSQAGQPAQPQAACSTEAAGEPGSTPAGGLTAETAGQETGPGEPLSEYPFLAAAISPVKLSVSELKRREQEESRFAEDQTLDLAGFSAPRGINLDLRDFSDLAETGEAIRGARLGTALHNFLRYLDLPAARELATTDGLRDQLARLRAEAVFSSAEENALQDWLAAVLAFVESDLAGRMVAAQTEHRLYREMPFTLALPASRIWPDKTGFASEDRVLVQGMIDCWFQEKGQAILVDYKTDRISGSPEAVLQILRDRYARQLDYYAQAIVAGTGLQVVERLIVHLPSRQIFDGAAREAIR